VTIRSILIFEIRSSEHVMAVFEKSVFKKFNNDLNSTPSGVSNCLKGAHIILSCA
jgi:hypothetical protein